MLVILAFLCLLVAACAGNATENVAESVDCSSSGYNAIAEAQLDEWEGVQSFIKELRFTLELTGQISELENILGEYKNLDIPDCYQPAHELFLSGMEYDLEGVKLLGAGDDVGGNFDLAEAEFAAARAELEKLDQE
jgi:hypothetical protein